MHSMVLADDYMSSIVLCSGLCMYVCMWLCSNYVIYVNSLWSVSGLIIDVSML